jgi:streptomycin 6-kinase
MRGTEGERWISFAEQAVSDLAKRWSLDLGQIFEGGLCSACCAVVTESGQAAVLKVIPPWIGAEREIETLQRWGGIGCPSVIAADLEVGAMLLERVIPGEPFDSHVTGAAAEIAAFSESFHRLPAPNGPSAISTLEQELRTKFSAAVTALSHGRLTQIDQATEDDRYRELLDGYRLALELAATCQRKVILHGDFQGKNLLSCQRQGVVAIDPFACIGEREYDLAFWALSAWRGERVPQLIEELCEALPALNRERLQAWAYVHAVAEKSWFPERAYDQAMSELVDTIEKTPALV